MESGSMKWAFNGNKALEVADAICIRGVLNTINNNLNVNHNSKLPIPLGHGDPSVFPCFRTTPIAEDAIVDAVRSAQFNCYSHPLGILPARRYDNYHALIPVN